MSNDFKKILVKDDRLMVSDSVSYAVQKGGQNVVCAPINCLSFSNSALTFNLQVPSEQTVVDRRLVWAQTISVSFTASVSTLVYGTDVVLAPFPSHQLCSTIQATINNNTTSINIRDVLPALLKMEEGVELQRFSGTTPTLADQMYLAVPSVGDVNNVNGGINIYAGATMPRGAFYAYPVDKSDTTGAAVNLSVTGSASPFTYTVRWSTAEPFICPPFLYGTQLSNTAGIYGVQNMTLLCNFSNGNRAIRFVSQGAIDAYSGNDVTVNSPTASKMLLNYLTPHPSDLMPARNVVPYQEFPRYFSTTSSTGINSLQVGQITSNTYNLNQIPDKIIIFARYPQALQKPTINDVFMGIRGISINFNNNAGILSSASTADLYRYSVEAGNNQPWPEWYGTALDSATAGLGQGTTARATVGSILALDFGRHIQLIEDYYAPGSLGNFQIQFNLDVYNQSSVNVAPELVMITVNSGVFVTERGQSSVYTGILTKQDVLDASQQDPFSIAHVTRKVGAGMLDRGKALPKHFGGKHKMDYMDSMQGGLSKRLM